MASEKSLEKAAQAWCKDTTKHLVMIPELAEAFAEILDANIVIKKDSEPQSNPLPPGVEELVKIATEVFDTMDLHDQQFISFTELGGRFKKAVEYVNGR
jgi:hypothetical protein